VLNAEIIWTVVTRPALLLVLGLTVILAWPLGRRRGAAGVVFVLVLGAILAATATTPHLFVSAAGVRPYLGEFGDPGYLVGGFGSTAEKWANIGLYLPLGLLATLVWRYPARLCSRPLRNQRSGVGPQSVVAGCALLSFLIEAWQGLIGRGGDAVDVVHNAFGALLGALLATAWIRARPPRVGADLP
jgi:glycopeptide antibiotics resistance protein